VKLAKIPTELYICIPRRSSRGVFRTNIWANLCRKDTGEGIGSKRLVPFLDNVALAGIIYTQEKTGYAGPFDINPTTSGLHTTYIKFEGDAQFELCQSEIVTLKVDASLLGIEIVMVPPLSGVAPLTVQVKGIVYEIAADGSKKNPAYGLPLSLMVFDSTSTRRLQAVNMAMSNPDGTYTLNYTFIKPGTYAIFVNFSGDEKHISAWSNNGKTTTITVTGGVPLSFEETITIDVKVSKTIKRILSPTEPTAPDGYERAPEYDLDFGIAGKSWAFIKKTA